MKCFACQAEILEPLPESGQCPHCGTEIARLTTIEEVGPHGRQTVPGDEVAAAQAEQRDATDTTALPPSGSQTMAETVEARDDTHIDPRNVLSIQQRLFGSLTEAISAGEEKPDYSLLNVLGEGGMGVVYRAQQNSVGRAVAVKMLRESGASMAQEEGFLSEVVVTGELEHPNIVPVYDLGRTRRGELFYAMRQVHGTPWSEVIGQKSIHENLEILMRVADAVAFAHSKGVVHRDIKPENVMLGDFGEVILMDWGLAFVTGEFDKLDTVRRSTTLGCTPAYAAPELAIGPAYLIGPASDVYLLGAALYEVITGSPPHVGKDYDECLENLVRNYIKPTDEKGELVDIALRAMRTKPDERFASVLEFQQAIRRYQSHYESLAISSRAEEDLKRARQSDNTDNYDDFSQAMFRFREAVNLWDGNTEAHQGLQTARLEYARTALVKGDLDLSESLLDPADSRHRPLLEQIHQAKAARVANARKLRTARILARVAAVVVIVVLSGAAYYSNQARKDAKAEERRARIAEQQAKDSAEDARNQRKAAEASAKDAETQQLAAEQSAQEAREAEAEALVSEANAKREEARAKREKARANYQSYLARIALVNENIRNNAFADAKRILKDEIPDLQLNEITEVGWEFSRLKYLTEQSWAEIPAGSSIDAMAFAPRDNWFVTAGPEGVISQYVLDRSTERRWQLKNEWKQGSPVTALDVSVTGQVASCGEDSLIYLWTEDGDLLNKLSGHTQAVTSVEFSQDGRRLLSTSRDHSARVWDLEGATEPQVLKRHSWWVWDAAFCSSHSNAANLEDQIVTVGQDGKAIVWMRPSPGARYAERGVFLQHEGPVFSVAAAPATSGLSIVATGGADGRILLWNAMDAKPVDLKLRIEDLPAAPVPAVSLLGHEDVVREVNFSPDCRWLLSGSDDNTVQVWDVTTGIVEKVLRGQGAAVNAVTFDAEGDLIVSGGSDGTVKVWDKDAYTEVRVYQDAILRGHRDGIMSVTFANQADRFLTSSRDHTARIWDTQQERPIAVLAEGHEYLASTAMFLRDETKLLTCALDNTARIWDVIRGAEEAVMEGTGSNAVAAVSPDGQWIVTGCSISAEKSAEDPEDGDAEATHSALLWSTDDVLDAAGAGRQCVPVTALPGHPAAVTAAAFAPDSRYLFTGDDVGRGVIWDVLSQQKLRELEGQHNGRIQAAEILELDGQLCIVTASADKSISQWDLNTGRELKSRRFVFPNAVLAMDVSRERNEVLVLSFTTHIEDERELRDYKVYRCRLTDESATPVAVVRVPGASVSSVAYGHEPNTAITVESGITRGDQAVRLWDLTSGQEMRITLPDGRKRSFLNSQTLGGVVFAARFSQDGQRVLVVGGNSARIVDPVQQNLQMVFSPHSVLAGADYTSDDRFIVTVGQDLAVKIWDADTGRSRVRVSDAHTRTIHSVNCSPLKDRYEFLTAGDDRAILWSYDPGSEGPASVRQLFELSHVDQEQPSRDVSVRYAVFSEDGRWIATGTDRGEITIWNARSGQRLATASQDEPITCLAFSNSTTHLVSAAGNSAYLWLLTADGSPVLRHKLQGHTATINTASFSPDGSRVLTGSGDTSIKLWDPRTGDEVLTLRRHLDDVMAARFSQQGDSVLSGSLDGTAILWLTSVKAKQNAITRAPARPPLR